MSGITKTEACQSTINIDSYNILKGAVINLEFKGDKAKLLISTVLNLLNISQSFFLMLCLIFMTS